MIIKVTIKVTMKIEIYVINNINKQSYKFFIFSRYREMINL